MKGLLCDFLLSFATARVSWSQTAEGKTWQVRTATCTFITGCRKKSLLLALPAQLVGKLQVPMPFPLSGQHSHWWELAMPQIATFGHQGPRGPLPVSSNGYSANFQWLKTLPHMSAKVSFFMILHVVKPPAVLHNHSWMPPQQIVVGMSKIRPSCLV